MLDDGVCPFLNSLISRGLRSLFPCSLLFRNQKLAGCLAGLYEVCDSGQGQVLVGQEFALFAFVDLQDVFATVSR